MFNVIIIGGDNVDNYDIFQYKCAKILSGKAKSGERIRILTIGDDMVDKFASKFGIETKSYNCDWQKYGKKSIYHRNKQIVSDADAIIYFNSNKNDLNNLYSYAVRMGKVNRKLDIEQLTTQ